jgi:DNA-binding LacI/PurR family transcriptional regulator
MPGRVTVAHVTREAGVSLVTVSRVLNSKEGVDQATCMRMQGVVEQLGYCPSDIACGLVAVCTGTLGLAIPDVANPFFARAARGTEHIAYDGGMMFSRAT